MALETVKATANHNKRTFTIRTYSEVIVLK